MVIVKVLLQSISCEGEISYVAMLVGSVVCENIQHRGSEERHYITMPIKYNVSVIIISSSDGAMAERARGND